MTGPHPNQGRAQGWLASFLASPPDTDGCVDWPFAIVGRGYPAIKQGRRMARVSRIVLTRFAGEAPPGAVAAHAPLLCHNPLCVNPRHLRWATLTENNRDRFIDLTDPRGTRNPNHVLTPERVIDIYTSFDLNVVAASRHGVSPATVSNIRRDRSWTWLTSQYPARNAA